MLFQRKPRLDAVLRPLLEQARALGAAERRVWLAELRADSPSVVSQLERLLATEAVDAASVTSPLRRRRVLPKRSGCGGNSYPALFQRREALSTDESETSADRDVERSADERLSPNQTFATVT